MESRTRPSSNYITPGDFPDSRPGATPVGLRGRWRRTLTCACPRAPQGNPTSAVSLAETFAGKLHPDQYTCARARLSRLCDPRTRGAKCFDLRDFRRGTSVPPSSAPLSLNVSLSLPPTPLSVCSHPYTSGSPRSTLAVRHCTLTIFLSNPPFATR